MSVVAVGLWQKKVGRRVREPISPFFFPSRQMYIGAIGGRLKHKAKMDILVKTVDIFKFSRFSKKHFGRAVSIL